MIAIGVCVCVHGCVQINLYKVMSIYENIKHSSVTNKLTIETYFLFKNKNAFNGFIIPSVCFFYKRDG